MDLKEHQRLSQLYMVFHDEAKQSVLNIITEYSDCMDIEIQKKDKRNN